MKFLSTVYVILERIGNTHSVNKHAQRLKRILLNGGATKKGPV